MAFSTTLYDSFSLSPVLFSLPFFLVGSTMQSLHGRSDSRKRERRATTAKKPFLFSSRNIVVPTLAAIFVPSFFLLRRLMLLLSWNLFSSSLNPSGKFNLFPRRLHIEIQSFVLSLKYLSQNLRISSGAGISTYVV